MRPMKFGIGQPVRRVEDQRFITGTGNYATDYEPAKAAQAYVLRSPHAHALFKFTDLKTAQAMPGVLLILTHADVADLGGIPCQAPVTPASGEGKMALTQYPVLPSDEVRHVGEAIAFIVAKSLAQARDAAEAVGVEWKALPAVAGIKNAIRKGAPEVWATHKGNLAFDTATGDKAKTDAVFAKAAKVMAYTMNNNRLVANYLENRSVVAEYNPRGESFVLTLGSQGVHGLRDTLAKRILKIDPAKIRVKTPDVGGGFGTKSFMYREYPLAAVAARKLGQSVRWAADRSEHFFACTHGRDNLATLEMAMDAAGKFLAIRAHVHADMGAYLSQYAPFIPWLCASMITGVYDIPQAYCLITGVYTNTVPVDAYRGAGRPEAAYFVERFVDHIAAETGIAPDKLRAKNFIRPKQFPYKTPVGRVYDSGDFDGHMRRAMEVAEWKGFGSRNNAAKRAGKIRGIGMSCYIEACGGGGGEPAYVTLEKDGTVTMKIGTQSNGQGHATAYAQLVAEHLDIPVDRIRLLQGDTNDTPTGGGTGGSRSIPVGGAAIAGAARKLAANLKELAAEKLEAGIGDLEIADGRVRIAGTDRGLDFKTIAELPGATVKKLSTQDEFKPPEATYPNGTHICEVEIDAETAVTTVVNYVIVDDFGVTLNPLLLAGQVHGGVGQGVGQALLEDTVYTDDGQLISASFMDYTMPRAIHFPSFKFETRNIPCVTNVLGVKGAGEAGSIGSTPAVMNAVVDALRRAKGVKSLDMPATPLRVWNAMKNAAKQ